jgi:hypothetical protein
MHDIKYKQAYFPITSSVGGVGIIPMGLLLGYGWKLCLPLQGYGRKPRTSSTVVRVQGKTQIIFSVAMINRVDSARMVKCTISSTLLWLH